MNAVRISEEAKKRVLETLDFKEKHPETGYKEYQCSAYCERRCGGSAHQG